MKKDYRLIQIIESIDNITKEDILIFEMIPVEYNNAKTGYNFNPSPSTKNHYFVYPNRGDIEEYYLTNPEDIKTINLENFNDYLINTPEGMRHTFFIKDFDEIRMRKKS